MSRNIMVNLYSMVVRKKKKTFGIRLRYVQNIHTVLLNMYVLVKTQR